MSAHSRHGGQRGIALIVTLIMLSVITFLTVTFLVLSQRETGSVTTSTDQMISKQAADTATERAKIELLGPMLAFRNPEIYDLMVSTNFINYNGYTPGIANFTNVSYFYPNGNPVTGNDFHSMLTNLLYNARVPVYMTNRITGLRELRYYLDLNRNGKPDTTGYFVPVDENGNPIGTNALWHVGDPEWIGILERPDQPHSSSNKFIARYAYIVVPAGKTLDVNYIHNQAKRPGDVTQDGFLRNQGVGSYEINLAAFLADLNTNAWPGYFYNPDPNGVPLGNVPFLSALDLLRYRYSASPTPTTTSGSYLNLTNPLPFFDHDNIDEYANGGNGTLMTGDKWSNDLNDFGTGFPAANNPTHFFTHQEFFNRAKINTAPLNFVDRLAAIGTNISTYNRYTFYRMLAQLGTDTEPDFRMNLNYVNVDANMNVIPGYETNLIHWTSLQFFTNAADRLLRAQFPRDNISVTNIPVYRNGQLIYSPVIHRMLQLAANMYEATTNAAYPSVYKPYFRREQLGSTDATNSYVYIAGFELVDEVFNLGNPFAGDFSAPIDIVDNPTAVSDSDSATHINIFGVPWVVGARKGLPNLNEVTSSTRFNFTRRLLATKPGVGETPPSQIQFSQQLLMDLWAELGVEFWNSYKTPYTNARVHVYGTFGFSLTNSDGYVSSSTITTYTASTNVAEWRGYGNTPTAPDPRSFVVPLRTNFTILKNAVYDSVANIFKGTNTAPFESVTTRPVRWGFMITNHVRAIIAAPNGRVLDYVHLRGPIRYRDLSEEVRTTGYGTEGLWNTNLTTSAPIVPEGVNFQVRISLGDPSVPISDWNSFGVNQAAGNTKDKEIAKFRAFYYSQVGNYNGFTSPNPVERTVQVPFTPTRSVAQRVSWQVNDPLVHYLAEDLLDIERTIETDVIQPPGTVTNLLPNIGRLNDRYNPWGGNPAKGLVRTEYDVNIALKDPGITSSDAWDFPTNKLGNIGWLGRVHRGTPWQTIYMKSADIIRTNGVISSLGLSQWSRWSGHLNPIAATNSAPVTDRLVFDLFTTTPNDNAARGRLSVNQTNLAAWSAVLSGVLVVSNQPNGALTVMEIQPAALSPQVGEIVWGIIATKTQRTRIGNNEFDIYPQHQFRRVGDILAVPHLSEGSPFIVTNNLVTGKLFGLNDAVIERIPQQIMSLLTLPKSPRFVIYSYGQALRPAPNSIIRGIGGFSGLCTNYQVVAESATRTVLRFDGSFDPRDNASSTNRASNLVYPPRMVVEQFNILPPD